jgi:hypothetical protein
MYLHVPKKDNSSKKEREIIFSSSVKVSKLIVDVYVSE